MQFILISIITLCISYLDFALLKFNSWGIDDASIFFKYARNLSSGHGFVFNLNDERVEGFTSLLWVLYESFVFKYSIIPNIFLIITNIFFAIITQLIAVRLARQYLVINDYTITPKELNVSLLFYFIAIGPSYYSWIVLSLMENSIWGLIFITTIYFLFQYLLHRNSFYKLLLLLPLLITVRPESIFWICLFSLIIFISDRQRNESLKNTLVYLLLSIILIATLLLFRMKYFGYLLPNTYYAKVSGSFIYNFQEGLKYLWGFVSNFNPFLSLVLVYFSVTVYLFISKIFHKDSLKFDKRVSSTIFIFIVIIAVLLLPLLTGGDHFGGYRFYTIIIPLLFIFLLKIYKEILNIVKANSSNDTSVFLFFGLFSFLSMTMSLYNLKKIPQTQVDYDYYIAKEGHYTGIQFNNLFGSELPSAGVVTAGAFSFSYNGRTIDLMGLNSTVMAHSIGDRRGIKNHAAFNKMVFYTLMPEIILPKNVASITEAKFELYDLLKPDNFENLALKNILNDSDFILKYRPYFIRNTINGATGFGFLNVGWFNSKSFKDLKIYELKYDYN